LKVELLTAPKCSEREVYHCNIAEIEMLPLD
jgi:hypothetical protein